MLRQCKRLLAGVKLRYVVSEFAGNHIYGIANERGIIMALTFHNEALKWRKQLAKIVIVNAKQTTIKTNG